MNNSFASLEVAVVVAEAALGNDDLAKAEEALRSCGGAGPDVSFLRALLAVRRGRPVGPVRRRFPMPILSKDTNEQ